MLLIPLLVGLVGAPAASGDELADALARQAALEAKIALQKEEVAELNGLQADLKGEISTTRQELPASPWT